MKIFNPESKLAKLLNDTDRLNYHLDFIEKKSVLGIDIYRYSDYPENVQTYVPVLFNSLYNITVKNCLDHEKFFFQNYGSNLKEFKAKFISTGDGGFQILENPIQAIIFTAYFQINVIRFNSNSLTTTLNINLYNIIGKIELRYALTFDKVFWYDNNYFGPAIINNARILSKDNLNRFLIDFPTLNWFNQSINTLENLMVISKEEISKLDYFKDHKTEASLLFDKNDKIKTLDILKIGTIKSKSTFLEIYNLKIQLYLFVPDLKKYNGFLVTLGNLNTQGIE